MLEQKIGILGGGQLARYLALKGAELGLNIFVYSENKNDPAAQVTAQWHQGRINDPSSIKSFLEKIDILTFESEFADTNIIKKAYSKINNKLSIHPSLNSLSVFQDRLTQKKILQEHKLPVTAYIIINKFSDLILASKQLGLPFVLKKRTHGYDGYGTHTITNEEDIKKMQYERFENLYIAEKFISFKKELAQTYIMSEKSFKTLPIVETFQKNNQCLWVNGPIKNNEIIKLHKKVKKLLKSLKYKGVFTIEYFLKKDGSIAINEVAPRVHNSAHYSLSALSIDQFSYHLHAILNDKLIDYKLNDKAFAMANLIGTKKEKPTLKKQITSDLFWYNKSLNRPKRKMGHINTLSTTKAKALEIALKEAKKVSL